MILAPFLCRFLALVIREAKKTNKGLSYNGNTAVSKTGNVGSIPTGPAKIVQYASNFYCQASEQPVGWCRQGGIVQPDSRDHPVATGEGFESCIEGTLL